MDQIEAHTKVVGQSTAQDKSDFTQNYGRSMATEMNLANGIGFAPRPALHTYTVWAGGNWMLSKYGKAVPEFGPFPDTEKEPQHNALYEDSAKPRGQKKWLMEDERAYGHRSLERSVGAVCPPAVLERLIQREESRLESALANVQDPLARMKFVTERIQQIRDANPPGQSWDGKEAILEAGGVEDLQRQLDEAKAKIAALEAGAADFTAATEKPRRPSEVAVPEAPKEPGSFTPKTRNKRNG